MMPLEHEDATAIESAADKALAEARVHPFSPAAGNETWLLHAAQAIAQDLEWRVGLEEALRDYPEQRDEMILTHAEIIGRALVGNVMENIDEPLDYPDIPFINPEDDSVYIPF